MSHSKFWQFIDDHPANREVWWKRVAFNQPEGQRACELLLEENPKAGRWISLPSKTLSRKNPLLAEVLLCLANGSAYSGSLQNPRRYDPTNVRFRFSPDDFESILHLTPSRGTIAFLWTCFDEDGLSIIPRSRRLSSHLRQHLYDDRYLEPTGGAIGFIKGDSLDLVILPIDYAERIERTRAEIRRMTAREKAMRSLRSELQGFVNLLGWEKVDEELRRLKEFPGQD